MQLIRCAAAPSLPGSKPFSAAASKGLFQALQLLLATFFVYHGTEAVRQVQSGGIFYAQQLRLLPLALRDPALPPDVARVSGLGLLFDGCPVVGAGTDAVGGNDGVTASVSGAALAVINGTVEITLAAPIAANGYFFVTAGDPPAADPMRWAVQASADGGATWSDVGASAWRAGLGGVRVFYPQLAYPTPVTRGSVVAVDGRDSWPRVLVASVGGFEWVASLTLSVVAGRLGRVEASRRLMIAALVLDVAFLAAAAGQFFEEGDAGRRGLPAD